MSKQFKSTARAYRRGNLWNVPIEVNDVVIGIAVMRKTSAQKRMVGGKPRNRVNPCTQVAILPPPQ